MDNEGLWAAAMAATSGEGDHEKRAEALLELAAEIAVMIVNWSVQCAQDVDMHGRVAVFDVLRYGRDGVR